MLAATAMHSPCTGCHEKSMKAMDYCVVAIVARLPLPSNTTVHLFHRAGAHNLALPASQATLNAAAFLATVAASSPGL